ncbi:ribose-5-phosphate isomerase, partial [Staphylococcus epidermidis]
MKDVKALKLMTLNDVLSQINGDMTLGIGTGSTMELLLPQMAQLIKERGYN